MEKDTKNKIKKQIASTAMYLGLAVAVVGLTTRSITTIISDTLDNSELEDYLNDQSNFGHSQIIVPDIPELSQDYELPVADNAEGIVAEVKQPEEKAQEQKNDDPQENDEEKNEEPPAKENEPKEPDTDISTAVYAKPADGYITREYSVYELLYSPTMKDFRTHEGIDIGGDIGSEVRAFCEGEIAQIYDDELMGTTVVIKHADDVFSYYQNLSPALTKNVYIGNRVAAGTVLGGIGESAIAESAEVPHLHFEIKVGGKSVDPTQFLRNQ